MKSGPLCALLWRILTWCTRRHVTLKARHIPGWLNVIADKLSRLGQTIQTEWSLYPEVFQAICSRWHHAQVDLFATRFNNKLPQFVSLVPDPQIWVVDTLSLSWEDLDPYAFPPAANLVTQPFNQSLHRNLSHLNLHAWLLEPQQSKSRATLRQWQHKLRLLKEDQLDPSMRHSGPFLQSGASVIRWTSGHHL